MIKTGVVFCGFWKSGLVVTKQPGPPMAVTARKSESRATCDKWLDFRTSLAVRPDMHVRARVGWDIGCGRTGWDFIKPLRKRGKIFGLTTPIQQGSV